MALVVANLSSDLESLFSDPPGSVAECADAWASAVGSFASSIVPASTTVTAAQATLSGALASAFASPSAAAPMESAFAAFAITVGSGMTGFVPTPPPAPVGFALQGTATPSTHADAAAQWASRIDLWLKTGTATPSGGGSPVPWS